MGVEKKTIRLDKIGSCIACGTTINTSFVDRDHFLPKFLLIFPENVDKLEHPFRAVVLNRRNVFKMCRTHHVGLDNNKARAFGITGCESRDDIPKIDKVNPSALIAYLREKYPITDDERYRNKQLECMIAVVSGFHETAISLNGEFPDRLKVKYQEAGDLAKEYARELTIKRYPYLRRKDEERETKHD